MEVSSTARFIHISPKKLKEFARLCVVLSPNQAVDRLSFTPNKGAKMLLSVIKSAISNAKNNAKLDSSKLRIKAIETNKGPFFKRYQPVSRGMAHQIKKRTSHIKVI